MKTDTTAVLRTSRKHRKSNRASLSRRILGTGIAAALLGICAAPSHALPPSADTWNGATDSLWNTGTNWSGGVPTGASDVIFPGVIPATGPIITLNAGMLANTLAFSESYTFNGGSLTLSSSTVDVASGFTATINSTLSFSNGLTKTSAGTLALSALGSVSGAVTVNGGTLQLGNGTTAVAMPTGQTVTVNNASTFNTMANASVAGSNGGDVFGGIDVTAGAGAAAVTFSNGGTMTNNGTVTAGAGGSLFGGVGINAGAGGAGATFTNGGTLINNGTITAGDGGSTYGGVNGSAGAGGNGVTFSNGGTLTNSGTISAGANGQFFGGVNLATGAGGQPVVFAGAAGTFNNESGGIINGNVTMGDFANAVTLFTGSKINGSLSIGSSTSAALTLDGTGTQVYSAAVTGTTTFSGALIKSGTGTWTLDQTFSHSGGTTINAGTLGATAGGSLGSGGVLFYSGQLLATGAGFLASNSITIADESTGRLSNSNTGTEALFSGGITLGTSTLAIGSAGNTGVVTLSGAGSANASSFVNVDFGTLRNGDASGFTQYTSVAQQTTVAAGATLDMGGFATTILNLQGAGTITDSNVIDPVLTLTSGNFSGVIQDGAGLVSVLKNGTASDVLTLTGTNTYTGGTEINGGTLSFANGSLGTVGTINFTGDSTLRWHGTNTEDVSGRIVLEDVNVTFDTNGNNVTLALALGIGDEADGTASVTKTGAGTLTLLGANIYTGGTNIHAGTLSFADGALGTTGQVRFTGTSTLRWESGNTQDVTTTNGIYLEDGVNATFDTNGNNVTFAKAFTLGESQPTGTAAITKDGAGKLTILAANGYTGGTTVAAGILFLGDGSTPGASLGTGDVTVNATAIFQLDLANAEVFANKIANSGHVIADDSPLSNYTMSGVISGVGDFTKTGANTVTLSALNTYTGPTYVQQGTLMAGISNAGGAGATGPGAFGQNSAVFVSNGAILQLNGFNVGIGSLNDAPTQVQTPAIMQNSSVTPATLTVGGGGGSGYFSGIIQDGLLGAAEAARRPSGFQQAPQTPAPLSLWKTGDGTQTLGGLNTYTGTTKVDGGLLRADVSNAGGIGTTGPGAFGNNSAVTVNGTGTLQLGGNDVGIGSLAGDAGGIVENSSFRKQRVETAIVPRSATATLTTGGNNADATFAGTIRDGVRGEAVRQPAEKNTAPLTGPLAFFKTGTGTETLTGTNSYTGGTTIVQGTLAAGSMKAFGSGDLTMTGGTLRTSGGPWVVDIGGGNISFTGGTYIANVGGNLPGVNHDQLRTTGSANISGGTLSLVQQNAFRLLSGMKVTLLAAAGGVAGGTAGGTPVPGASVTGLAAFSNTPVLIPVVNLYTTSVILETMQGSFTGVSGLTPNQKSAAKALDSLAAITGGHTGVINELDFLNNQDPKALPALLDKIGPDELTAIFHLAKSLANVQSANILSRLDEIRAELERILSINSVNVLGSPDGSFQGPAGHPGKQAAPANEERWSLWMVGSGEFTHVGSTVNAAGFNLSSGGVTAGVDYRFSSKFVAGISIGYMNTSGSLANGGSVDVDGGRVGAYATYFDRGFHVDASVSGGPNSYRTRRVTANNTIATGSPEGTEVNLLLAAGYDWKKGALTIGPDVSFQYTNVQLDGFNETGTFAPLSVIRKNAESLRSSVGFRAAYDIKAGRALIRPEVRAAWQHEYGDTTYSLTSSFATLGGSPFTVFGPTTGRDSLLVRAGVNVQWNDRFSTYAYYDGELLRKNYSSNNVSLGVRWKF